MQTVNSYFLRSIKDVLRWDVLKLELAVGIPISALWIAIGWVLWPDAVAIAAKAIGWVPFSIVKATGAHFILFFIWFISVLVSFAVITALIGPPILRRFTKSGYYYYTFGSLILLSSLWASVLLYKWSYISAQVQKFLTYLPFQTVAEGTAWLIAFYIFYNLYILTLYFIISIFRKPFLDGIKEIDYPDVDTTGSGISKNYIISTFRDSILFILLSVLLLPVVFIPFANIIVQIFLWAWLYRESYFLSCCNAYCSENDYQALSPHRYKIWSVAIFASLLNFLPVINMFAPFFAQIMFFHWIMEHKTSH